MTIILDKGERLFVIFSDRTEEFKFARVENVEGSSAYVYVFEDDNNLRSRTIWERHWEK